VTDNLCFSQVPFSTDISVYFSGPFVTDILSFSGQFVTDILCFSGPVLADVLHVSLSNFDIMPLKY
jgi:hypothetical protein